MAMVSGVAPRRTDYAMYSNPGLKAGAKFTRRSATALSRERSWPEPAIAHGFLVSSLNDSLLRKSSE